MPQWSSIYMNNRLSLVAVLYCMWEVYALYGYVLCKTSHTRQSLPANMMLMVIISLSSQHRRKFFQNHKYLPLVVNIKSQVSVDTHSIMTHKGLKLQKSRVSYHLRMCVSHGLSNQSFMTINYINKTFKYKIAGTIRIR